MSFIKLINNFDGIYLDARSQAISIYDIDKFIESNAVANIVIKNWNKSFINSNIKALNRIKAKSNVSFSLLGRNSSEIQALKDFVSGVKVAVSDFKEDTNRMVAVAPWISKNNGKYIWNSTTISEDISRKVKRFVSQTSDESRFVAITANVEDGLYGSDVNSLTSLYGIDRHIVSSYSGIIRSSGKNSIWVISIDSISDLSNNIKSISESLKDININSVMIVFKKNRNKHQINLEEYIGLASARKNFNIYVYGAPVMFGGIVSNDLDRFKWITDVSNIDKLRFGVDEFNKNNIYLI